MAGLHVLCVAHQSELRHGTAVGPVVRVIAAVSRHAIGQVRAHPSRPMPNCKDPRFTTSFALYLVHVIFYSKGQKRVAQMRKGVPVKTAAFVLGERVGG